MPDLTDEALRRDTMAAWQDAKPGDTPGELVPGEGDITPEPQADPRDGQPCAANVEAPATARGHGMIPGSHERAGGPECRCGAAWDRWSGRCGAPPHPHAAPATVDGADLRATIRAELAGIVDGTFTLHEALPDVLAGRILRALTAAYDAYLAAPKPATVDGADLRDVIEKAIDEHRIMSGQPRYFCECGQWNRPHDDDEAAELFDAHRAQAVLAALTAAGWPGSYQPDNPHVAAAREARAEVERLRGCLEELLITADGARDVPPALVAEIRGIQGGAQPMWPNSYQPDNSLLRNAVAIITAAINDEGDGDDDAQAIAAARHMGCAVERLTAERDEARRERDAERERADNLARDLKAAQGERVVSAVFGHHKGAPRPFSLYRRHDVSGVSGTGVVALGAQWPDGTTVIRWLGDRPSTVVWESMEHAEAVHGHDGATRFVWLSDEFEALAAQEKRETCLREGIAATLGMLDDPAAHANRALGRARHNLRALLDDQPETGAVACTCYSGQFGKPHEQGCPALTDATETGADPAPPPLPYEQAPFAGDEYNGFTLTAHDAIPKGQDAIMRLTRDGATVRVFPYPAYKVWTLLAHWREFDEVNPDPATDATETGADQ